jgi:hypothetical protein
MRVTLNGIKRTHSGVSTKWLARKVYIWSREHGAYWREGGAGYTDDKAQAGIYDFQDAYLTTRHCGREKQIEYIAVPRSGVVGQPKVQT